MYFYWEINGFQVIELNKMISRENIESPKKVVPDDYEQEKIEKGFLKLGHVRRISSPAIEKMSPRNNKMYYINEFQNLDPPKDSLKLKILMKVGLSKNKADKMPKFTN